MKRVFSKQTTLKQMVDELVAAKAVEINRVCHILDGTEIEYT